MENKIIKIQDLEIAKPKEHPWLLATKLAYELENVNLEGIDKRLLDRVIAACLRARPNVPDDLTGQPSISRPEDIALLSSASDTLQAAIQANIARQVKVADGLALPEGEKIAAVSSVLKNAMKSAEFFTTTIESMEISNPYGINPTKGEILSDFLRLNTVTKYKDKVDQVCSTAKEAKYIIMSFLSNGMLHDLIRAQLILEAYYTEEVKKSPFKEFVDAIEELKIIINSTSGIEITCPKLGEPFTKKASEDYNGTREILWSKEASLTVGRRIAYTLREKHPALRGEKGSYPIVDLGSFGVKYPDNNGNIITAKPEVIVGLPTELPR